MERRSFVQQNGGAVAAEFALIVPALLLLLFGGFELTRLASASMRLTDAAETIADLVSRQKSVGAADIKDFCDGASIVLKPFPTASFRATIASVTHQGSLFVVDWQDTTCGAGQPLTSASSLAASYIPLNSDSIIVVQASLNYSATVGIMGTNFPISSFAYARSRLSAGVHHS